VTCRRWYRRGRRAAGLTWLAGLGALWLGSFATLPGTGPGQLAAQTLSPAEPPAGRAPRDTTGQAALRWQVERPQRAASLLWAERTVYRIRDGEAITYYYGNVYLDRDTLVVRADSAHVFRERDLVRLFDNVRIRRHETRIAADWAEYRHERGEADLRGQVRVVEALIIASAQRGELRDDLQLLRLMDDAVMVAPDYTITADTLVRDTRQEHGEAFGNVQIVDLDGSTVVTGQHGLFAYDGSWAEVDSLPTLWTRDGDSEPVLSEARRMLFYRYEDRAVMVDSVRIVQGDLRAFADTATAFGRDHMILQGNPRLEDGTRTRMFGEHIEFFYRDGVLDRVILLGQARMEDTAPDSLAARFRGLPPLDVLEGDSIAVHFRDGEIFRTDVIGQAHSIYVPLDLDDEVAFNEVRGDTLILRFQDERVAEVEVRGNMTGTYHFARVEQMGARRPPPESPPAATADSASAEAAAAVVDTLAHAAVDTLALATLDTLARADTLARSVADTLALAAAAADTFEFTPHAERVIYSGHSLLFDMIGRTIAVSRDAELSYGTMTLRARDVILDTESRELYADGDPLLEDGEIIVGQQMGYDFGHRTGAVRQGVTSFDGYFYVGDQVNRYPDGSLKICSGRKTSCDHAQPHYHFWADRMKLRLDDRIVAAPIVLKVGRVPIFALPFYFNSLKQGRRSGILFPNFNFGWTAREGRYIRDLGYYWATNDYTDFTFEIDYNERRELAWRVRNRYAKRYAFTGSVDYNALRGLRADEELREWQFRWRHDQPNLFDDYRFRSDVEMASRELSRSNLNQDRGRDIISGQLKSSVYISRSFGFGGASLNASRTEFTNARDDDPTTDKTIYNMTLPALSLNFKQITLGRQLRPGQQGSFLGNVGRATYFSQGYNMSHQLSETEETRTIRYAGSSNWGLTVRPPRIGIFNVNFGANSSWNWTRSDLEGRRFVRADSSYVDISDITEVSRPSLAFTSGIATTLYGVFPVAVGPLQAIRHTLRLNSGISYRPQLGSKQNRGHSYTFSAGNRFDIKYLRRGAQDTVRTVHKLDGLIDWGLNTSYNPDAQRPWSDIGSSLTFKPGQSRNLAFRLNNTIDPYAWKIIRTQFNYGFGLSGRIDTGYLGKEREDEIDASIGRLGLTDDDEELPADEDWSTEFDWGGPGEDEFSFYGGQFDVFGSDAGRTPRDDTDGGRYIPFNLSGNLSLSHTAATDRTTARANISSSVRLTRHWDFSYSAAIDLESRRTTRQEYRLQRDLHCWRLEFTRTVSAQDSQFGFRFYLIAIPELKLTRGKEDLLGGLGGGMSSLY
jgi:lipopolysaccharide assembly outer membrane protein LptD (OstA)